MTTLLGVGAPAGAYLGAVAREFVAGTIWDAPGVEGVVAALVVVVVAYAKRQLHDSGLWKT